MQNLKPFPGWSRPNLAAPPKHPRRPARIAWSSSWSRPPRRNSTPGMPVIRVWRKTRGKLVGRNLFCTRVNVANVSDSLPWERTKLSGSLGAEVSTSIMFMTFSIEIGNCEELSWHSINNITPRKLLFAKQMKRQMGPDYVGQSMCGPLVDWHLSQKEHLHGGTENLHM